MRHLHYTILICCLAIAAQAQQLKRDSILLYERSVDRPLTLHKGQLRISPSYNFLVFNKRYDNNNEKILLTDDGITKVQHALSLDFQYGITEYLQVIASFAHRYESQRSKEVFIILSSENPVAIHDKVETKGLEDIRLGIDYRIPGTSKKIDLVVSAGGSVPTAKVAPGKPKHEVVVSDVTEINYHYVNRWGSGVPFLGFGIRTKIRSNKLAYNAGASYWHAVKEGSSKRWKHQLYGSTFEYYEVPYEYQLPNKLNFFGGVDYQAFPWMIVFLEGDVSSWSNAWSDISGRRVMANASSLLSAKLGLELLVTHQLWLRQSFAFCASGRNQYAPFSLSTTVSYNLFP